MKELPSQEHYCHKICILLLMKSTAYPAPYMDSYFYKKNLRPFFLWFLKNLNPHLNKGDHTLHKALCKVK